MTDDNFDVNQFSESSILVTFNQKPDENLVLKLQNLRNRLLDSSVKSIVDINFTFNSLLIIYHDTIDSFYDVKLDIISCINQKSINNSTPVRTITLPVCYDDKFGLDLKELSSKLSLSPAEIIRIHSSTEYLVAFLGFLPGFPYLLNLDERLHCLRKDTPRPRIEKGAVGIGGAQTGIYPQDSPGGWQLIGNCPVDLYGKNWQSRTLLKPTDKIIFEPVNLKEYYHIKTQFEAGNYKVNIS